LSIHELAVISDQADIADGVTIGAFSVIQGKVKIGRGTHLENNVSIGCKSGEISIGENNYFLPGAVVGGPPQDLKYKGEPTELVIGNNNVIREFVTINVGTASGGGVTQIGNDNLLMAYVHIAHDCVLGDHIVIANSAQFAGHVVVEDHAIIGGVCAINQFVTIGKYSYIAGDSSVNKDILPYSMAQGKYAVMRATNKVGLERAGFSKEEIENIHKAIRAVIMGNRTVDESLKKITENCSPSEHLDHLIKFINASERGLAK